MATRDGLSTAGLGGGQRPVLGYWILEETEATELREVLGSKSTGEELDGDSRKVEALGGGEGGEGYLAKAKYKKPTTRYTGRMTGSILTVRQWDIGSGIIALWATRPVRFDSLP